MKITILGSGTFVPKLNRHCSSYLFEIGKEKLIFDFGRGTIDQLLKLKINLYELNKIFITHMHTDHASELASFISFIIDNPYRSKLREKYFIYGPQGIKGRTQKILEAFGVDKHKNILRFRIVELTKEKILKTENWSIQNFGVKHDLSQKCIAYRLKVGKKIICYSGDSADCLGLRKACKDVDLAIVEATLPRRYGEEAHVDGRELGKLAKDVGIKKLIATHVADFYLPKVKNEIEENYEREIKIAKDLMVVRV